MIKKTIIAGFLAPTFLGVSAPVAEEEFKRDLSGFTGIELGYHIDMDVEVGHEFSVTIIADEEHQAYIETEVRGNRLMIDVPKKYHRKLYRNYRNERRSRRNRDDVFDGELLIVVTLPELNALKNMGAGDIHVEGLNSDNFEYQANSSGDLTIAGKCAHGYFSTNSSGDIDGAGLECQSLDLEINSSGDQRFNVYDKIEARTSSSGSFYLAGTCSHGDFVVDSSGDLRARDLTCQTASLEVDSSGDSSLGVAQELRLDMDSSGDVDIYGDPSFRGLRKSGSGDLEIHDRD